MSKILLVPSDQASEATRYFRSMQFPRVLFGKRPAVEAGHNEAFLADPLIATKKKDGKPYRVRVMRLSGYMFYEPNMFSEWFGVRSVMELMEELQAAYDDTSTDAIIIRVNSGGGQALGTEQFAQLVAERNKPVVFYVEGMCASAAYWVASQGDAIYAAGETDIVGSVGAIMVHQSFAAMLENDGVKVNVLTNTGSEKKKLGNQYEDLSDEARENIQKQLNGYYAPFRAAVLKGRKDIKPEALDGRVFMSKEAISLGMIDGIGAIRLAAQAAVKLVKPNTANMEDTLQETIVNLNQMIRERDATISTLTENARLFAEQQAKQETIAASLAAAQQANEALTARVAELEAQLDATPAATPRKIAPKVDASAAPSGAEDPYRFCLTDRDRAFVDARLAKGLPPY